MADLSISTDDLKMERTRYRTGLVNTLAAAGGHFDEDGKFLVTYGQWDQEAVSSCHKALCYQHQIIALKDKQQKAGAFTGTQLSLSNLLDFDGPSATKDDSPATVDPENPPIYAEPDAAAAEAHLSDFDFDATAQLRVRKACLDFMAQTPGKGVTAPWVLRESGAPANTVDEIRHALEWLVQNAAESLQDAPGLRVSLKVFEADGARLYEALVDEDDTPEEDERQLEAPVGGFVVSAPQVEDESDESDAPQPGNELAQPTEPTGDPEHDESADAKVLSVVGRRGTASITDLVAATGLSKSKVMKAVEFLKSAYLVVFDGKHVSTPPDHEPAKDPNARDESVPLKVNCEFCTRRVNESEAREHNGLVWCGICELPEDEVPAEAPEVKAASEPSVSESADARVLAALRKTTEGDDTMKVGISVLMQMTKLSEHVVSEALGRLHDEHRVISEWPNDEARLVAE